MRYIDDFLSEIKKALGVDNIVLFVGADDWVKNEDMIKTKLKMTNNGRFYAAHHTTPLIINLKINNLWICQTTLSEYPACCGKAIMHSISLNNQLIRDARELPIMISNEQARVVFNSFIGIIGVISRLMRYGSLDFVISESEQLYMFKAVDLPPKETFINPRLRHSPHTLHSYSLDINKFGEVI